MLSDLDAMLKLEEGLRPLRLQLSDYEQVMELMDSSLNRGLGSKADDIQMYVTYVRSLPDGTEVGRFLALDLGGTNFRVLLITLENGEVSLDSTIYMVPESIMLGTGRGLFDHIASCIKSFVEARGIENELLPLGFTFSFPCRQEGLAKSRLVTWTKGFKCTDVEGEDIVKMLEEAMHRQNMKVKCVAVINDTVGTLMACAHVDRSCQIGLILGTGTNACYLEQLDKVEKWTADDNDPSKHTTTKVVINTEWGAFGNNGALEFLTTEFDKAVDAVSKNPGEQIYEKMISGMYMGEVARQVIVKLSDDGCMFKNGISTRMRTPMMFYTKYISEVESDAEFELDRVRMVLDEVDIDNYTITDCLIMREICSAVSTRAAYLAASGVAALLRRLNENFVTVAVDGSLYKYHPYFHDLMTDMVTQLLPETKFRLMQSNDGSGVGAALVAAVSTRQMSACRA